MVNAGEINKRITIKTQVLTQNSYGEEIITWSNFCTVWAKITSSSGKEFYAVQKLNPETTALFKIRYRSGLDTSMRIYYGTRIFDILYIDNVGEGNVEINLLCKELI